MRIGFVADDLYPGFGGQASATQGHIEALVRRGHEVRVLAGREAEPTRPPDGVQLRRLPAWQPGETQTNFALPSPSAIRWLTGWADVVHINTPTPLALAAVLAAKAERLPSVIGIHTQLESSTMHFRRGRCLVEGVLSSWFGLIYSLPDALVAPTPFAARTVGRFSAKPVHVVSNGVRLPDRVLSRDEARRRLAAQTYPGTVHPGTVHPGTVHPGTVHPGAMHLGTMHAKTSGQIVLYLGRLAPEKRPQDLLSLMEHLDESVALWVAGTGPLAVHLQREAERMGLAGRVHFLGYVSEEQKQLLLAAADLFVMPSPTELQSIATLEAMAHGCAVAAASYGTSAVPDVVREAGAGVVYPPDDLESAARQIQDILDDRERLHELKTAASAGAERHSLENSAAALEAIYWNLKQRREILS